jgi:hypothetical protein
MTHKYQKHYTRDEARALLPQIREWLVNLRALRDELAQFDQRIAHLLKDGQDAGGEVVNSWVKQVTKTKRLLSEFAQRDIQVKDLERGLIDFPAIIGGREVFLCWEQDEEDIEFWHDLDTGYAGRERL